MVKHDRLSLYELHVNLLIGLSRHEAVSTNVTLVSPVRHTVLEVISYPDLLIIDDAEGEIWSSIFNRGTQREFSSKPLKHSIVKRPCA